jgi:hypothetical protein
MDPNTVAPTSKARSVSTHFLYRDTVSPKSRDPTKEYFSVGHDRFHSILEGFTDGWYNQASVPEPSKPADSDINLRNAPQDYLQNLSFLFGGVGDGEL